jgi:hypothetical protein
MINFTTNNFETVSIDLVCGSVLVETDHQHVPTGLVLAKAQVQTHLRLFCCLETEFTVDGSVEGPLLLPPLPEPLTLASLETARNALRNGACSNG